MFLTDEQVEQVQGLCEMAAGSRTRSGKVTIVIRNNMPREFLCELPVFDDDHMQVGYVTSIYAAKLPEEEIRKGRQKNRRRGKT